MMNYGYARVSSKAQNEQRQLDALMAAAQQYPDDVTANLNAASACVRTQRLTDAKRFLTKAGSSAEAIYLADVIRAMEGTVKWRMEDGKVIIIAN